MKTLTLALAALVLTACVQVPALAQKGKRPGVDASRHGWMSSFAQGRQQAMQSGKPLMVVLRCQP